MAEHMNDGSTALDFSHYKTKNEMPFISLHGFQQASTVGTVTSQASDNDFLNDRLNMTR